MVDGKGFKVQLAIMEDGAGPSECLCVCEKYVNALLIKTALTAIAPEMGSFRGDKERFVRPEITINPVVGEGYGQSN